MTRNADGAKAFDNLSVRCLAYFETLAGKLQASGSCVEVDADGDKVFTTFAGNMHQIVGGSGGPGGRPAGWVSRLPGLPPALASDVRPAPSFSRSSAPAASWRV